MTPGEQQFEKEAWDRANQYGDEAPNLIDRFREEMYEEIERERISERENRPDKE